MTDNNIGPREKTDLEALRPITKDHHHQDSLFGNSFQSKSFFIVHPEWISETVDNTDPEPLHRPPWPWEQPRYRQNIQIPITYKVDENRRREKIKQKTKEKPKIIQICQWLWTHQCVYLLVTLFDTSAE
ncbi:uncharacterized protein LOC132743497 isoform X3 [Ruditapes philippinarum]|uniref:uncharacterized protein LOC132743497 isoform X3 n=1 Tax=Ruditapes philippinarum TaxID=129788 RepID=UPI00295BAD30|nr:uncharacterized protein LOC132743497 isoform X3 [Ruditapes philippinarum]